MKTLNSYTVIIKINDNEEIFNKAYINGLDNSNLAIKGAIDVLSGMNEDKYIGILVVREKMLSCGDGKFKGDGVFHNTYSHIYNDRTNWVTVKEAKQFLMSIKA